MKFAKFIRCIFLSIILFLIVSPICLTICNVKICESLINENRNLEEFPLIHISNVNQYPEKLDKYFNDRIGLREIILPSYIWLFENLLESSVSEHVTGKNGELFINHAAPVVDASLGILPYSVEGKRRLRVSTAGKFAFLLSKNIFYQFFLIPDKSSVYPELLPWYSSLIPHNSWYDVMSSELSKINVGFVDIKPYFDEYSNKYKLYDKWFDNGHWNGIGIDLGYKFIANILSKKYDYFKPVNTPEYYEIYDRTVDVPLYGKELSSMVKLNKLDNIICTVPPDELSTSTYNIYCENNNNSKGSLLFFSDSYFADTHGLNLVSPFVHNVKYYNHRHYHFDSELYSYFMNQFIDKYNPDVVIEAFVERMGGPTVSYNDPLIRILGDVWLGTDGAIFDHKLDLSQVKTKNCDLEVKDEVLILSANNNSPEIEFISPKKTDDMGYISFSMNIVSPEDTIAKIFYTLPGAPFYDNSFSSITLKKGENLIHFEAILPPNFDAKIKFSPGEIKGIYKFKKISQLDELRERMKQDGI